MTNKSFLGQSSVRGLRNNNPGNLRRTNEKWQGKVPFSQSTDNEFEQFITVAWGLRAMYKNMITHIGRGKNTISKLISVYAPPNENDTQAYVNQVAQSVGISATATLTANSETIIKLAKAMVRVELGAPAAAKLDNNDYQEAWGLMNSSVGELSEAVVIGSVPKKCPYCLEIIGAVTLFFFTYIGVAF